jgi:hypothetical protein
MHLISLPAMVARLRGGGPELVALAADFRAMTDALVASLQMPSRPAAGRILRAVARGRKSLLLTANYCPTATMEIVRRPAYGRGGMCGFPGGGDPDWACGAGLLSLYVEAQTFPSDEASEMVLRIEDWYQNAIETEFGRLP